MSSKIIFLRKIQRFTYMLAYTLQTLLVIMTHKLVRKGDHQWNSGQWCCRRVSRQKEKYIIANWLTHIFLSGALIPFYNIIVNIYNIALISNFTWYACVDIVHPIFDRVFHLGWLISFQYNLSSSHRPSTLRSRWLPTKKECNLILTLAIQMSSDVHTFLVLIFRLNQFNYFSLQVVSINKNMFYFALK